LSIGHRISLKTAIDLVLCCTGRFRLPEPIRGRQLLAAAPRRMSNLKCDDRTLAVRESFHAVSRGQGKGRLNMRIPHELRDEFPDQAPLIERLVKTNYEFGRLAAAYDEVNRHIWQIESEDEPTTDEVLEKLKKRRLLLKDDIAALLIKERPRM
jgi:uncharacterized protein